MFQNTLHYFKENFYSDAFMAKALIITAIVSACVILFPLVTILFALFFQQKTFFIWWFLSAFLLITMLVMAVVLFCRTHKQQQNIFYIFISILASAFLVPGGILFLIFSLHFYLDS